jgi:hypothetical protein
MSGANPGDDPRSWHRLRYLVSVISGPRSNGFW